MPVRNEPIPKKLLIGGVALCIATAFVPLGMLVLPAFIAYAMFRARPGIFAVLFGAFAACTAVLFWPEYTTICGMLLLMAGSTLILYYMQKKKMSNVTAAAAISGVAILSLYLIVCLPGILSGEGAFAFVKADAEALVAEFQKTAELSGALLSEESQALFDTYMKALPDAAVLAVMPVLSACGMAVGLSSVLFFRLFARKRGFDLAKMRPFRLWSIPRELTVGLCILLVGAALMNFTDLDYAENVSATVNVLVGLPLTLQGVCCLDYLLFRRGGNVKLRRILVYIGVGVFFYLMQMGLMLVGCIEQVFRFRDRAEGVLPPRMPREE